MAARTVSRLRIGLVTMALVALATVGWQDSPPNGGQPAGSKAAAPAEQAGAPAGGASFNTLPPELEAFLPKIEDIKPIPLPEIPDNPPPHEGAMIDIPYVVESPDILVIDLLEALPGRPIEGERLVRPDGTISLDFYGDLHVRGLTTRQIKEKLVLHFRKYLGDDVLGMIGETWVDVEPPQPVVPGGAVVPRGNIPPGAVTPVRPPMPQQGAPLARPGASRPTGAAGRGHIRLARIQTAVPKRPEPLKEPARPARVVPKLDGNPAQKPAERRPPEGPAAVQARAAHYILIPPAESDRVLVDVAAYNSKVYYIQGDVAAPGRLPITGKETVLDALNNVGGLLPTADEHDIRIVRPGRGGKPGKVYKVDLAAIQEKGDPRTNYQVFPGDRVFVGRHPIVQNTLDVDRQVAPSHALLQSLLIYTYVVRSLNNIKQPYSPGTKNEEKLKLGDKTFSIDLGPPTPPLSPAEREAILKAWAEFHRAIVNRPEGAPLDAELIRKGLLHAPVPAPSEPPKVKDKPSK